MEFGKESLTDNLGRHEMVYSKIIYTSDNSSSTTRQSSSSPDDHFHGLSDRIESFHMLKNGVPRSDSTEKKLSWLRSQIIGGNAEFNTPFGKRRLTYSDHTASGRSLQYIENYILNNVLPFYGNHQFIYNRLPQILTRDLS
ncbi:Aminotransferase class-V domain-containing protein [Forsythia ovata]|uniref:Aminotransferase class-V domain-containing protein n=1 Tax=Forsythia ovata TaxID=205694 RepID=A0ABD1U960_9LAMI